MSRFLMVHRKIMKLIKITITFFKIAYVDATKDVEEGIHNREKRMIIKSDFLAGWKGNHRLNAGRNCRASYEIFS